MSEGYILAYRKMEDNPVLADDKYDKTHAWLWILFHANHATRRITFNGKMATVKRGQFVTSVRKMASAWGWSPDKVLRFLRSLEENNMVKRSASTSRTLLTVENYNRYQPLPNTNKDTHNTNEYANEYTSRTPQPIEKYGNTAYAPNTNKHTNKDTNKSQTIKNKKNDPNGTALGPSVRGLTDSEFYDFELGEPLDAYW
jgi:DNA replication protein DnaD